MGVNVYIAFEGERPRSSRNYEGKYLMDDPVALDAVARGAGLRSLISFLGNPAEDWMKVTETIQPSIFHDSEEGAETLTKLADMVESGVEVGAGYSEGIVWTLRGMAKELAGANKRWCLWLAG